MSSSAAAGCGQISETKFPACQAELGGDFAIAATYDAHDGRGTVWAGGNPQTRIDYAYRSVHVVSVAAKAIQKAFYGVAPAKSYWIGCSTGGREGLIEAQSFPREFDRIIAGAPANLQSTNPIYMAWTGRTNTDAKGGPILMGPKTIVLHAAVMKACDGNDGVAEGGRVPLNRGLRGSGRPQWPTLGRLGSVPGTAQTLLLPAGCGRLNRPRPASSRWSDL